MAGAFFIFVVFFCCGREMTIYNPYNLYHDKILFGH